MYQDPALPALPDSTLPAFRFPFTSGEGAFSTEQLGEKPHLLIVFTPEDCSVCFSEIPFWERLQATFGDRVNVVGIVSGHPAEKSTAFLKRRKINIPVAVDPEGRMLDFLQLRNTGLTPVKVFVDPSGRVWHVARTTYANALAQLRYARALHTLLGQSETRDRRYRARLPE
ncbi:TlpA family protein disulfide reductase [Rhodocaloribacter litoris]|uniref:TlpA family protein disulfide reductase n=1 Tax=Rhodocaloribacter litoris TaxID=2558931 RepID=UPI0014210288|nr:TlpA disulfide reductase family protein [Rhodocaloribacter litoris]QXD16879.1 TlpA family protein disulfide reductase [Rhodocaloribacter litoris]